MKINKDFKIEGWNAEEHVDGMAIFHQNEVFPRIRKNIKYFDIKALRYPRSSGLESILNDKKDVGEPVWVMPYLPNHKEINLENKKNCEKYWKKYREFVLFGSDVYKMKACGLVNNIQARQYLDKHIGKLHKK